MPTPFRWGLIGPGRIAHRFAQVAQQLPNSRLVAVTGRDAARTAAFARAWSWPGEGPVACAVSVRSMLERGDLDAVYIATPHAFHAASIEACLRAGMPVLCEKPLVTSAQAAEPLMALSRSQGVFLMEALWTRFLPIYGLVGQWLQAGLIGPVRSVQSSFCFNLPFDAANRCFAPELAGGALLDIGIYNLACTRWVLEQSLGACPELLALQSSAVLAPTGVDQRLSVQMMLEGGIHAQCFCAFDTAGSNGLVIQGERGSIAVPQDFWQATRAVLHVAGAEPQLEHRPFHINGFEGEVLEAMRCIAGGQCESPLMPHAESLALVRWMDRIRQQVGVRYPFEA